MKRKGILVLAIPLLAGWLFAGCAPKVGCCAPNSPLFQPLYLIDLPTTEKLDGSAKIKGKVAVVKAYPNSGVRLEGFDINGRIDRSSAFYFSPERKANSTEEIETLVKINCRQGKVISGTTHVCECEVSAIDYKTETVFAKKSFVNDEMPTAAPASGTVPAPSEEMKNYLRGFSTYE